MKPFIDSVRAVVSREVVRIAHRPTLYLLSIVLPIGLFTFFALIYMNNVVREIPVGVVDLDQSEISHLTVRSIDASGSFRVVQHLHSASEIEQEMRKGRIQVGFLIPQHLERNIKRGTGSTVTVYNNATNLIVANTTLKDATTIIKMISGGILLKKISSQGLTQDQAMDIVNPITVQAQALFNPTYNYLDYLVPGLLPVMLQMIIMVASVLVVSSEFSHGTFSELASCSNNKAWALLIGKALPHFGIHSATALGIIGIIFPLFGIEVAGSVIKTVMFFLFFVAASLSVGITISALFHDQQFATELALFINTPAFIFSGYIFPMWAMPKAHVLFAQVMPFTHFLSGFLKLYHMGAGWSDLTHELSALSAFIIVSTIISVWKIGRDLKAESTAVNVRIS